MEIKTLQIKNFRNISNSTNSLTKFSCFVGKNHSGKTNHIQSVYNLLTGHLLDDSSNDMSLKPIGNESQPVATKISFVGKDNKEHTIEKVYQEKWTKTRGSDEVTLTGHETKYIIDDIEFKKVIDARKEIDKLLCMEGYEFKNIDKYSLIMNPLYVGDYVDYRDLRALIINRIGDVRNEDIFSYDSRTLSARETLEKYNFQTEKANLFCTQTINDIKESVIKYRGQIDYLNGVKDIPSEELKSLETELNEINKSIEDLNDDVQIENPTIKLKQNELNEINAKALKLVTEERNAYNDKVSFSIKEKDKIREEITRLYKSVSDSKMSINYYKTKVTECDSKITLKQSQIDILNGKRNELLNQYNLLKDEEYIAIDSKVCPHCGGVINEEELEEHKALWENQHKTKLDNNIALGKSNKLQIDSLKMELEEQKQFKSIYESKVSELEEDITLKEQKYQLANENYNKIEIPSFETSNEYKKLIFKQNQLKGEINELKNAPKDVDMNKQLQLDSCKHRKEEIQSRLGVHYSYLNNQTQVEKTKDLISNLQKRQADYEIEKECISLFAKIKIDLLDAKIKMHFGDEVRFVLLQNNLKEGSWDQVCYPLIVGTNTPFKNGSKSEKVITGIKIIEVLKKEFNMPDLPILIDEISELDSNSMNYVKSISNSQIIATKVDDKYDVPTLENI